MPRRKRIDDSSDHDMINEDDIEIEIAPRRRGRPPKRSLNSDFQEEEEEQGTNGSDFEEEEEEDIKDVFSEDDNEEEDASEEPKRRGRPRKMSTSYTSDRERSVSRSRRNESSPIKRGRGRPPKNATDRDRSVSRARSTSRMRESEDDKFGDAQHVKEEEDDDEDEEDEEVEVPKRGRGRPPKIHEDQEHAVKQEKQKRDRDEKVIEPTSVKSPASASLDGYFARRPIVTKRSFTGKKSSISRFQEILGDINVYNRENELRVHLLDIHQRIISEADRYGRLLCEFLMELPSKDDYPDYYEVITNPIDMNTIKNRIENEQYKELSDALSAYQLLYENAHTFNEPGSQIYKDVDKLSKLTQDAFVNKEKDRHRPLEELAAQRQLLSIYDAIITLTDVDHRVRSELFMTLPSRKEYPDYYQVIENPLDFTTLKHRMEEGQYTTIESAREDFLLVFKNAKKYNEVDSQVYQDANIMQRHFEQLYTASIEKITRQRQLIASLSSAVHSTTHPALVPASRTFKDPLQVNDSVVLLWPDGAFYAVHIVDFIVPFSLYSVESSSRVARIAFKSPTGDSLTVDVASDILLNPLPWKFSERASNQSIHAMMLLMLEKLAMSVSVDEHRYRASWLWSLPNRELHPDFYEKVKEPVSLSVMRDRLLSGRYGGSFDPLDRDCQRMFLSGEVFYEKDSAMSETVLRDIDALRDVYRELKESVVMPFLKQARELRSANQREGSGLAGQSAGAAGYPVPMKAVQMHPLWIPLKKIELMHAMGLLYSLPVEVNAWSVYCPPEVDNVHIRVDVDVEALLMQQREQIVAYMRSKERPELEESLCIKRFIDHVLPTLKYIALRGKQQMLSTQQMIPVPLHVGLNMCEFFMTLDGLPTQNLHTLCLSKMREVQ